MGSPAGAAAVGASSRQQRSMRGTPELSAGAAASLSPSGRQIVESSKTGSVERRAAGAGAAAASVTPSTPARRSAGKRIGGRGAAAGQQAEERGASYSSAAAAAASTPASAEAVRAVQQLSQLQSPASSRRMAGTVRSNRRLQVEEGEAAPASPAEEVKQQQQEPVSFSRRLSLPTPASASSPDHLSAMQDFIRLQEEQRKQLHAARQAEELQAGDE